MAEPRPAWLEQYRSDVGSEPELDHYWFPATLAQARRGIENARQQVARSCARIALRVADDWCAKHPDTPFVDALREANTAMLVAIGRFPGWRVEPFVAFLEQSIRKHLDALDN
jgi:hypothetical protein